MRASLVLWLSMMVVAAGVCGCLEDPEDGGVIRVDYQIKIIFNNPTNGTIVVPLPILNGEAIHFQDYQSDFGYDDASGDYDTVDTEYGEGLQITLVNCSYVTLSSRKDLLIDTEYNPSRLGMIYHDDGSSYWVWVYSNLTGLANLDLSYAGLKSTDGHFIDSFQCVNGWNKAEVVNTRP